MLRAIDQLKAEMENSCLPGVWTSVALLSWIQDSNTN